MAIDFVVGVKCAAKSALGQNQLMHLNRTRILARAALAYARADGDRRAESEIEVGFVQNQGSATPPATQRTTTVGEMLAQAAPLDAHAAGCGECRAAVNGQPFSCHQRIAYPITEAAEEWLVAQLPRTLDCAAGALLVRGLEEFKWDGAPVAKLRARAGEFFESRVPYGMRWKKGETTVEVSSDQLLQMMFFVGDLAPTHALMLALFFGAIPHTTTLSDIKDAQARSTLLARATIATQKDQSVEQIAAFLRAAATAAYEDVPLFVDG